jgi:hypothetical protein
LDLFSIFRDIKVHRELLAPKVVKGHKERKEHKELRVRKDHKELKELKEHKVPKVVSKEPKEPQAMWEVREPLEHKVLFRGI